MESGTIICNCKQVTYGQIENVVREEKNISNVVQVFDDVQKQTMDREEHSAKHRTKYSFAIRRERPTRITQEKSQKPSGTARNGKTETRRTAYFPWMHRLIR